jgi:protein-L-isoaspartate(D-aspartate) O-methyltransferase
MDYEYARERMVEMQIMSRGINDPGVLAAMRTVPRHLFVEESLRDSAYEDHPIPIGEGQTISQPYMVALMTELLEINSESVVLEVGTGSGYQSAILAEIAKQVYTVERLAPLAEKARQVFEQLHYDNIEIRIDDGTLGWNEHAPYDGIIVAAGAPAVPESLVEQLAEDGKLVIPVGNRISQVLQVLRKHKDGSIATSTSCHCVFVKLIGKDGWAR